MGGKASLMLEDTIQPFKQGVLYRPCPPNKRALYEVDQLSGGEKTMAALALLFALMETVKAPFVVLDEVDAFLDKENAKILADFVKKRCQEL